MAKFSFTANGVGVTRITFKRNVTVDGGIPLR